MCAVCAVLLVVTKIRYMSISLLHFEIECILQYHLQFDTVVLVVCRFMNMCMRLLTFKAILKSEQKLQPR